MKDILLVDGYNMIGDWPELKSLAEKDMEEAREQLIRILADYQGYSGLKVILVFDAHLVPGLGGKMTQHGLEIIFTREKETADECIERLVAQLDRQRRNIIVATSDHIEQRITFGKGALRLSARELRLAVLESREEMERKIEEKSQKPRNSFDLKLNRETKHILEKWRRGE